MKRTNTVALRCEASSPPVKRSHNGETGRGIRTRKFVRSPSTLGAQRHEKF